MPALTGTGATQQHGQGNRVMYSNTQRQICLYRWCLQKLPKKGERDTGSHPKPDSKPPAHGAALPESGNCGKSRGTVPEHQRFVDMGWWELWNKD